MVRNFNSEIGASVVAVTIATVGIMTVASFTFVAEAHAQSYKSVAKKAVTVGKLTDHAAKKTVTASKLKDRVAKTRRRKTAPLVLRSMGEMRGVGASSKSGL